MQSKYHDVFTKRNTNQPLRTQKQVDEFFRGEVRCNDEIVNLMNQTQKNWNSQFNKDDEEQQAKQREYERKMQMVNQGNQFMRSGNRRVNEAVTSPKICNRPKQEVSNFEASQQLKRASLPTTVRTKKSTQRMSEPIKTESSEYATN